MPPRRWTRSVARWRTRRTAEERHDLQPSDPFRPALARAGLQLEDLGDAWLRQIGNPRSNASSRKIIEWLPAEPILTVARAAEMADVSNTAADNAVHTLQDAGILRPLNERRWGRRWEAPDVFTLLDDFERELATPQGEDRPARPAPRRPPRELPV